MQSDSDFASLDQPRINPPHPWRRRIETMATILCLFVGGFGLGFVYASRIDDDDMARMRSDHLAEIGRLQQAYGDRLDRMTEKVGDAAEAVYDAAATAKSAAKTADSVVEKADAASAKADSAATAAKRAATAAAANQPDKSPTVSITRAVRDANSTIQKGRE